MKLNEPNDSPSCCNHPGRFWLLIAAGLAAWAVVMTVCSCAKPAHTKVPSYEEARQQALKEAPFIQKTIEERQSLKCDDKPTVLKKNPEAGIPHTGLLITNKKAVCLVGRTAERDRLRKELSAERLRVRTRQIINDAAYKRLAEASKQSWWDKHSWKVLSPVLLAVGSALTIAVMYALTGGKPISTSSQTHVIK